MAYRLISGRPVAQEIKRLLDEETLAAAAGLAKPFAVDRVHATRKHIKKARALLRVAREPIGKRYVDANDDLRTANRALGPLVDAHNARETFAAICREGIVQLPPAAHSALREQLAARAAALARRATAADVRARTARLLKSARQEVASADLREVGRAAMVAALRDAHAAARKAQRSALKRPSVDSFHRWRRAVKREWHLMRLISELTGDRLRDQRHQLAALDACLGELHDVDVLIGALAANSPLSRTDQARVLSVLRAHAHDLRHLARRLSTVLDERPEQLAHRVRVLWGSVRRRRAAATVRAWPHSA